MIPILQNHIDRVLALIASALKTLQSSSPGPEAPAKLLARFASVLEEDQKLASAEKVLLPDLSLARRYDLELLPMVLLWLAVAPYLEPEIRKLVMRANDNIMRYVVDPSLCLRLLGDERADKIAMMAELSPPSPLLDTGLMRLMPGSGEPNWLYHEICPNIQVVNFFCGLRALSPKASRFTTMRYPSVTSESVHTASDLEPLVGIARLFYARPPLGRQARFGEGGLTYPSGLGLVLAGSEGQGRATAARAIAGSLSRGIIELDAARLMTASTSHAAEVLGDVILAINSTHTQALLFLLRSSPPPRTFVRPGIVTRGLHAH